METGASYLEAVRPRPGLSLPPLMPHSASATHGLSQLEQYLFVSGRLEDGGESPAGGREGESNEAKSKIARKREANGPIKPTRSPERTSPKYRLYILMNNLYLVVDTGARGKEVMDTKVKIDTIKQHLELHYHTECHI